MQYCYQHTERYLFRCRVHGVGPEGVLEDKNIFLYVCRVLADLDRHVCDSDVFLLPALRVCQRSAVPKPFDEHYYQQNDHSDCSADMLCAGFLVVLLRVLQIETLRRRIGKIPAVHRV